MSTTPSPTVWTLSGMTAETIVFREKWFIATHWIISFLILSVIPIVYFMNRHAKNKKRTEKAMKQQNISNGTSQIQMLDNKTSDQSCITTELDEVTQNNSHQNIITTQTVHTRSKSNLNTRKRKLGKSLKDESAEKWNKAFKIVSILCVFLWWWRAVTAACSLMIWHYQPTLAARIAFEWDLVRSLMYHTSKLLMYLMYMSRIYHTFRNSKYAYPKWFMILLYVLVILDYITKLIVFVLLGEITSGKLQDKGTASDFLEGAFIFLVVEEFFVTVLMIGAFIKPLIVMSMDVLSTDILEIISKYTILGLMAIISSCTLSFFRLMYIGSFDLMVIWMTAVWVSVDCLINTWCILLLFNYAKPTYLLLCGCCDMRLTQCMHKITKERATVII